MAELSLAPLFNELPSDFAERLGRQYADRDKAELKKVKGQFFTPVAIARLMASFSKVEGKALSILDPGSGAGVLSAALVEQIVKRTHQPKRIDLVAYETDPFVLPLTESLFSYLQNWLNDRGIAFSYQILEEDFVLKNAAVLKSKEAPGLFDEYRFGGPYFDIVITNPPYFKLNKDDIRVLSAPALVSGHPNIYALFLGISAHLLKPGGEMVSITPRSFASGQYFKAFREDFFQAVRLSAVHLFKSRKEAFDKDSVLQETIVLHVCRQKPDSKVEILLSSSHGLRDIDSPATKYLPASDIIDLQSSEKILHLPVSDEEERILELVSSWKQTLRDFQIQVSTGPVVAFRAESFIHQTYSNGTIQLVPLFWMHHVVKMELDWPKVFKQKGQYIRMEAASRSQLLPNKDYILLRRFSTKDDKSRLIAAPYFAKENSFECIGIENKVNYLYRKGGILEKEELIGLCALLNSRLYNSYFQMFNGNVNVSASELREMKFPPLEQIRRLGSKLIAEKDHSMETIDLLVTEIFEITETVHG